MKRACVYLLMLSLVLVLPLRVSAAVSLVPPDAANPDNITENDDGTVTRTYTINMSASEGEEAATAKIQFQYGTAVKKLTCEGAGDFALTNQEDSGANTSVCSFAVPNGGKSSGASFPVAKFSINVDKSASDEDCTVGIGFAEDEQAVTGEKTNPETGAMVPYLAIGGCAIAAVAVYVVTKRRSLYKI